MLLLSQPSPCRLRRQVAELHPLIPAGRTARFVAMLNDEADMAPTTSGTQTFSWQTRGRTVEVAYDIAGQGRPVLLLPALSTASTRAEMWTVARQLGRRFRTVAVDWPGFGVSPRPRLRWRPEQYRCFLADLCDHLFEGPTGVVAAGHAAGYVLQLAVDRPATWSRIALVAPTWRGPLPTAMGDHRRLYAIPRQLLQLPLFGEALYRLSVTSRVLTRMYRAHVYADPSQVTPRLIEEKGRLARQKNARYAAAAFLTGGLDPVRDRAAFLALVDATLLPILAVCGTATPDRSWREMATLRNRSGVMVTRVPGALAAHEEHPAPVSRAVADFLLDGTAGSS